MGKKTKWGEMGGKGESLRYLNGNHLKKAKGWEDTWKRWEKGERRGEERHAPRFPQTSPLSPGLTTFAGAPFNENHFIAVTDRKNERVATHQYSLPQQLVRMLEQGPLRVKHTPKPSLQRGPVNTLSLVWGATANTKITRIMHQWELAMSSVRLLQAACHEMRAYIESVLEGECPCVAGKPLIFVATSSAHLGIPCGPTLGCPKRVRFCCPAP